MTDNSIRTQDGRVHQGTIITIAVAIVAVVILALGNPSSEAWVIKCPLHQLTGCQCPLCGSQRAIHALMHGNIAEAWHHNPALWVALPYLVLWSTGTLAPSLNRYRIVRWAGKDRVILGAIALMLAWGVTRNLLN